MITKKGEFLEKLKSRNSKLHYRNTKKMIKMSDLSKAVRHMYNLVFKNPSEHRKIVSNLFTNY